MSDTPLRQEINLLDQCFRPQAVPLAAQRVLTVGAVRSVALGAYYAYARLQLPGLTRQAAQLHDKVAADRQQLERLSAGAAHNDKLARLDGEIHQLEAQRKAKATVVDALTQRRLGNTTGFSAYLEGLARHVEDGLWLSSIDIDDGGGAVSLAGTTVDPKLVPAYLQRLSQEAAFSGTDFNSFEMRRQDKQPGRVDFVIKTAAGKGRDG